jgi:ABC-type amino acid transport system permease subunit
MVLDLLIGLPGDRPGGLVLSILLSGAAAAIAVWLGFGYALACRSSRVAGLPLQGLSALVRGVPLILLAFALAQFTALSLPLTGLAALALYSFSHTGEILRGFLAAYPEPAIAQARVMGLSRIRELLVLRVPFVLRSALGALQTHWISLLKDSGALVVIGVGELTTTARLLAERSASVSHWGGTLALAASLYLATTLALVAALRRIRGPMSERATSR